MKKNNIRYTIFAAMAALASVGWTGAFRNGNIRDIKFCEYIEKAQEHECKEAYITAADNYVRALEIRPSDTEIMISAAENYMKCGDRNGFLRYCNMAAETAPEKDRSYLLLGRYYHETGEIKKAQEILNAAPKGENSDEILSLLHTLKYEYKKGYRSFSDVGGFYGEYCAVCDETGKWGLADKKGDIAVSMQYDAIGAYNADEDIVPICDNGKWYFIDIQNRKKYAPDREYSYLGTYSCGYAPFEYDGKYGYMSLDYEEDAYGYDFAGTFSDGIAAVKLDGKWALIDAGFEEVTGFVYDDIKVDRYGACVKNGRIYAVCDGINIVLDLNGSETDDEPAFICGLSPVCKNGKWGYADSSGNIVIENSFENVLPFSPAGTACVLKDGMWSIIWLSCME